MLWLSQGFLSIPAPVALPAYEVQTDAQTRRAIFMSDPGYVGGFAVGTDLPHQVRHAPLDADVARFVADVFVAAYGNAFGPTRPADVLAAYRIDADNLGLTHVRYHQFHQGVPVFGAELIVHLDADARVYAAGGHLAPDLQVETTPRLTADDAQAIAEGFWYADLAPILDRLVRSVTLGRLTLPGDAESHLVWQVRIGRDCPLTQRVYHLDAQTTELRDSAHGADQPEGELPAGFEQQTNEAVAAGSRDSAVATAQALWQAELAFDVPQAKRRELWVLVPGLLNHDGDKSGYLAWEVQLFCPAWIDQSYFVDAATGKLRLTLDHIRRQNRKVYDCSSKPGTDLCSCDKLVHYDEYDPHWTPPPTDYPFGIKDVNPTYPWPHGPNPRYLPEISTDSDDFFVWLWDVHTYYQTKFNRNGSNGQGGNTDGSTFPLNMDTGRTYLNWLSTWADDCKNAVHWDDVGEGFCKWWVVPDVVGHEYAHGLNYTDFMTYQSESGALDESHSDVMGEMFEFWKTGSNDWVNAGLALGGPVRSLIVPPSITCPLTGRPYPDRYNSPDYYCGSGDNYGVHVNSTVPSKALYLASMGDSFNGCTVSGIGRAKVEQILYRARTVYYSGSESFNSACSHLLQACADLYGAQSNEHWQLTKALRAVELDQPGYCSGQPGWPPQGKDIRYDTDDDGDVDLADFATFQTCYGPQNPLSLPCGYLDAQRNNAVDVVDFGLLAGCWAASGPEIAATAGCGN